MRNIQAFLFDFTASPENIPTCFHPHPQKKKNKKTSFAEDSNDCLQPPRSKELLSAMSKVRAQLWMEIQNQDA